ncbi:dienelactone hydrolase family protein [Bdellovibrio bacteriovorus]
MKLCVLMFCLLVSSFSFAAIKEETLDYMDGNTTLEGVLVYDDAWKGPRPVVVIIHQFMGLTEYEKMRARMLAQEGYVAFAADIYGKGVRPKTPEEAFQLVAKYMGDIPLYRSRVKAAVDFVATRGEVMASKTVVMGYCFGGAGALEAARANIDNVVGVVSFHGVLSTPNPQSTQNVKASILVAHGAVDPLVPRTQVEGFLDEMNRAKADYKFVAYANAVHSFTHREAGDDPSDGVAYNELADKRSWRDFMDFLNEVAPTSVK